MGRFTPPPPSAAGSLAELSDVDVDAGDAGAAGARLQRLTEGGSWGPKLPSPFDGYAGSAPDDVWQTVSASHDPFVGGNSAHAIDSGGNLYWVHRIDNVADAELRWVNVFTGDTGSKGLGYNVTNHAPLSVLADRVYILTRDDDTSDMHFTRYNPQDDTLVELSTPATSINCELVANNGRLHMLSSNNAHNVYDPSVGSWSAGVAHPNGSGFYRTGLASGAGALFTFDGVETDKACYMLPAGGSAWERIADLPTNEGRAKINAVYLSGLFFVWGGTNPQYSSTIPDSTMWVYSPAADAWDQLGDHPAVSSSATTGAAAGRIFQVGGNSSGGSTLSDLYIYG